MSEAKKAEWTLWSLISTLVAVLGLAGWGVAIAFYGYPAIIVPALVLCFSSLIALVVITRG